MNDLPTAGDVLASAVRGNDVVIRWTTSEVLVVLAGVCGGVAERVAERIRGVVETRSANRIAVSGDVTELRTTDSLEDIVERARQAPAPAPPVTRGVARRSDRQIGTGRSRS
jgi:GGDEF domain-containing protein